MGLCSSQSKKNGSSSEKLAATPTTSTPSFITQGELDFRVRLSNIKIKMDKLLKVKVKYTFGNFGDWQSQINEDLHGRHYLKQDYSQNLHASETELYNSVLTINILNEYNEILSNIQLNLYDCATGPSHFDYTFIVQPQQGSKEPQRTGKLSFDLKISQVIVINVQTLNVKCIMLENLIDYGFQYSFRLLTRQNQIYSESSSVILNPAYHNNIEQSDQISENKEICLNHMKMSKAPKPTITLKDQTIIQNQKQLVWDEKQGIEMDIEVPINEVALSSLQFCLWRLDQDEINNNKDEEEESPRKIQTIKKINEQQNNNKQLIDAYDLLCETYISLNLLVRHQTEEGEQKEFEGQKVTSFICDVEKGLWNHGQNEGTIQAKFQVNVPLYLQQQIVGVRTNKCVQQGSSVIKEGQYAVKEIQDISKLTNDLTEGMFNLQNKNLNHVEKSTQRGKINRTINNLKDVLKKTSKESIVSFMYASQNELFKAQDVLLKLATHLINTAENLEDSLRDEYYLIMRLIYRRGELDLNQLGFTAQTEQTSANLIQYKLQIGLAYERILILSLQIVLLKMEQKAFSQNEKQFMENFWAQAFFQIPQFRKMIIQSLSHEDDPPIKEWRGTEFKLEEDERGQRRELYDLFDWEHHFYDHLDKQQKGYANKVLLTDIVQQTEWRKRFQKRGVAFFQFVRECCSHIVQKVVKKEHIPWQDVPGYRSLLKGFLLEMKKRPITHFPDAMRQAMMMFLNNQDLLNIFVVILYSKTNLFESETVVETFNIINECFQSLQTYGRQWPTQFDQGHFLKGINIVLNNCEHAYSVAKCLLMIHNNYSFFPSITLVILRREITNIIFPLLAPKFFMHWSYNVRIVFQNFLLYRIFHLHKSADIQDLNEDQLLKQYHQVVKPKKQQSFFDSNKPQVNLISNIIYTKYLTFMQLVEEARQVSRDARENQILEQRKLHKAMKEKLTQKRMNQRRIQLNPQAIQQAAEQSSQIQSFLLVNEEDELELEDYVDVPTLKKQQQKNQLLVPSEMDNKPQLAISEPKKRQKETQIKLTPQQLKYMPQACIEYDELKARYAKWRAAVLLECPLKNQTNDDKEKYLRTSQIPTLVISLPQDEREGNIGNREEW